MLVDVQVYKLSPGSGLDLVFLCTQVVFGGAHHDGAVGMASVVVSAHLAFVGPLYEMAGVGNEDELAWGPARPLVGPALVQGQAGSLSFLLVGSPFAANSESFSIHGGVA